MGEKMRCCREKDLCKTKEKKERNGHTHLGQKRKHLLNVGRVNAGDKRDM